MEFMSNDWLTAKESTGVSWIVFVALNIEMYPQLFV